MRTRESGGAVHELTVTGNIGRSGAAVYSNRPLSSGRYLRVSNKDYHVSLMAYVRNQTKAADGRGRLHMQFLGVVRSLRLLSIQELAWT